MFKFQLDTIKMGIDAIRKEKTGHKASDAIVEATLTAALSQITAAATLVEKMKAETPEPAKKPRKQRADAKAKDAKKKAAQRNRAAVKDAADAMKGAEESAA